MRIEDHHAITPSIYRWLGRRRGWLVLTQFVLIAAIVFLGMADPAVDPDAEFIPEITHKEALTRARTALQGIERLDTAGISALSVALRTLRGLLAETTTHLTNGSS